MATEQVLEKEPEITTEEVVKNKVVRSLEEIRTDLIKKGNAQGYLSYQEINKVLPDKLPTEEFEDIINILMNKDIELVDDDEANLEKKVPVAEKKKDEPEKPQGFEDIDDSVRVYLREIGKILLLTMQEEVTLAKRIEHGDQEAQRKLLKLTLG